MNEKLEDQQYCGDLLGKRECTVSGKISVPLNKAVRECIDGVQYKTVNDVVEIALFDFVQKRTDCVGGMKIGV